MPPKKNVVSEYRVTDDNAVPKLQKCLEKISNPSQRSRIDCFELSVFAVKITPTILALLVQLLNQPLPKTRSAAESKWDRVSLCRCTLTTGSEHTGREDQAFCSQQDIEIFGSTLACRTLSLRLGTSPDILECLLNTPQFELKELSLGQMGISRSNCARLAGLVQNCVSLKHLEINVSRSFLQDPLVLVEGLANALHLESIAFRMHLAETSPALSDVLVRNGGTNIVEQLLCPQSRLQKLVLVGIHLEDRHFLPIVEMLPTAQLQVLDVTMNTIGCQGILSFARQLPRIKSLKVVDLSLNPWMSPYDLYEECIVALLHGMMENYSIEDLCPSGQETLLQSCMKANRVRRIILETANSIPVGLWPWILERVGTRQRHSTQDEGVRFQEYRANALYFVLQNSPLLSFASLRMSRRKRKRVDRYR